MNSKDLNIRELTSMGRTFRFVLLGAFVITGSAAILSFFRVDHLHPSLPPLYFIYFLLTAYVIKFSKTDLFSPLMIFILFSWVGFGIKLPWLSLFPHLAFFEQGYRYNFQYSSLNMAWTFGIFLIGYVAFIIGFNLVQRGIRSPTMTKSTPKIIIHPLGLTVFSIVLVIIMVYVRKKYYLGLPGLRPSINYAGYIYYATLYSALLSIGFQFYVALQKNSQFYVIMGVFLFAAYGLALALLGWKGGISASIILILMMYYYTSRLRPINRRIRRSIFLAIFALTIMSFSMFPIIGEYRRSSVIGYGGPSLANFLNFFSEFNLLHSFHGFFRRFWGLDFLFPAVAYFRQDISSQLTNHFLLLDLQKQGISAVQFYTWFILGGNPNIITANGPTMWGALYISGGIIAVFLGMFLAGVFSKVMYLKLISNFHRDGRLIVFYALFMINIFLGTVFGGVLWGCLKSFLALVVMYILFTFAFKVIRSLQSRGYLVRTS